MNVSILGSLYHLVLRHLLEVGSVTNVISNAAVKQRGFLKHYPDPAPQPSDVEIGDVSTIKSECPSDGVVESLQEGDDCALPASTWTHQSKGLPRLD